MEDLQNADEVAGIAYVHGIGKGGYCPLRDIFACLKVSGHHVVGVTCCDEVLNGET